MPRAFLTGATGFVGSHLTRHLLSEGWEVHALAGRQQADAAVEGPTSRVTMHAHDGSTQGMIRILGEARPDVVFHLASLFLADHRPEDVEALVQANLLLGTQLAEAMSVCGVTRMVNTGTSWQHYHQADYRPVNLYAATKQAFEDILAYYHDARDLSCVTLKLYDTYGPRDRRRKLMNILFDTVGTGEPIAMSPGEQVIDLVHVDDAIRAFLAAADLLMISPFPLRDAYLVSGHRLTVCDLVVLISQVAGRPIQPTWGGRPYRSREVMLPVATEGRRLPGWKPRIDLEAGIAECLASRGIGPNSR